MSVSDSRENRQVPYFPLKRWAGVAPETLNVACLAVSCPRLVYQQWSKVLLPIGCVWEYIVDIWLVRCRHKYLFVYVCFQTCCLLCLLALLCGSVCGGYVWSSPWRWWTPATGKPQMLFWLGGLSRPCPHICLWPDPCISLNLSLGSLAVPSVDECDKQQ